MRFTLLISLCNRDPRYEAILPKRSQDKNSFALAIKTDTTSSLREREERRAIERLVAPHIAGREEAKQDLLIHKESETLGPHELLGSVVAKDVSNELHDKKFLSLSGGDGRSGS